MEIGAKLLNSEEERAGPESIHFVKKIPCFKIYPFQVHFDVLYFLFFSVNININKIKIYL